MARPARGWIRRGVSSSGRPGRSLRRQTGVVAPTLVYDGDCGICQASVRLLRSLGCRAEMVPSAVWVRDHPSDAARCADAVLFVEGGGEVLAGERAIAAALRRVRRPGPLAAAVLDARGIRPLAGRVYRWVAANRARLSARLGLDACATRPR